MKVNGSLPRKKGGPRAQPSPQRYRPLNVLLGERSQAPGRRSPRNGPQQGGRTQGPAAARRAQARAPRPSARRHVCPLALTGPACEAGLPPGPPTSRVLGSARPSPRFRTHPRAESLAAELESAKGSPCVARDYMSFLFGLARALGRRSHAHEVQCPSRGARMPSPSARAPSTRSRPQWAPGSHCCRARCWNASCLATRAPRTISKPNLVSTLS